MKRKSILFIVIFINISIASFCQFHIRVDCYCTQKECGVASWCIRATKDNWKSSITVMTSFYTYEATYQEKLFQNQLDAIYFAKGLKSYEHILRINDAMIDKYKQLKRMEEDRERKQHASIKII